MDRWMDRSMDGWIDGQIDRCMATLIGAEVVDTQIDGCTDRQTDG